MRYTFLVEEVLNSRVYANLFNLLCRNMKTEFLFQKQKKLFELKLC